MKEYSKADAIKVLKDYWHIWGSRSERPIFIDN